jgi:hypothetical protein
LVDHYLAGLAEATSVVERRIWVEMMESVRRLNVCLAPCLPLMPLLVSRSQPYTILVARILDLCKGYLQHPGR